MRLSGTKTNSIHQYRGLGDQLWDLGGARPGLDLQFSATKNLIDSVSGQSLVTFTRASTATYFNGSGVLTTAAVNEARLDHNPTTGESLGLLIEEARTNSIRNNTMVGAVAGTPGTLPTNWAFSQNGITGISYSVVGTGTQNGINYVDLRLFGTPSATVTQGIQLPFESSSSTIAASPSQTWTQSVWVSIVGGSAANITSFFNNVQQYNSGAFVNGNSVAFTPNTTLTRYTGTVTFTAAATTNAYPLIGIGTTASAAIDITLRIGLPQLEQGAFATSVIPTTTATATRSADVASITGANFSSWYRQDAGTVFAQSSRFALGSATGQYIVCEAGNSASNNNELIQLGTQFGANNFQMLVNVGNVAQAALVEASTTSLAKYIGAYTSNDFAYTRDGSSPSVDVSGSVPSVSQLNIGSRPAFGNTGYLNGTIRRLTYWPQRLANSTLQAITL